MGDIRLIKEDLDEHHDLAFGFVIYRCVYGDDAQWARFMERLTEYVNVELQGEAQELEEHFDWTIMEDEARYGNASKGDIRKAFKEWSEPFDADKTMLKYAACIYADQEVIDAVLNGEDPRSSNMAELENPRAYVKLVLTWYDPEDWPEGDDDNDDEDEVYPAVEGCTLEFVGWMKVAARALVPRAYAMLSGTGLTDFHVRPPAIWNE